MKLLGRNRAGALGKLLPGVPEALGAHCAPLSAFSDRLCRM